MSSGDFLFWINVTHFVPKVGFVCTTTFGSLLLFLNYLGAQKNFGSYKYLISAFTLLGMVFSMVEILVYPYALGTYFFLARDEVSDEYFREEVLLRYNANVTELPAMSIVAYDPVDGSIRWWNLMGVVNICSIVNFQYGIMIYCGWAMHSKMEDKIKHFSETLRKHHKQFFKTLVLQITTPTIILFIPITIIIFLPVFNLDVSLPSGVMLCSFTLYPATDSMIVMYVVSEYKNTAKRIHKVFGRGIKEIQSSKAQSTVNPTSTAPTS